MAEATPPPEPLIEATLGVVLKHGLARRPRMDSPARLIAEAVTTTTLEEGIVIRVLAVCGMGLGTSVILKSRLKEALDAAGVEYTLDVVDAGAARGQDADIIFTSDELADRVRREGARVVVVRNFTSRDEVGEKVRAALAELEG